MLDDQIRNLPVQLRLMRQDRGPWWSGFLLLVALLLVGVGIWTYYAVTAPSGSNSAGTSMDRIRALPVISIDAFIGFLDSTGRNFSFQVHSNEIVIILPFPEGSHKLYRLEYAGKSLMETEHILTERQKVKPQPGV